MYEYNCAIDEIIVTKKCVRILCNSLVTHKLKKKSELCFIGPVTSVLYFIIDTTLKNIYFLINRESAQRYLNPV